MSIVHKIIYIVLAVLAISSLIVLDWCLPENTVGIITGVSVKRMDNEGIVTQSNSADIPDSQKAPVSGLNPTRDVYFVYVQLPDGDVKVYRNEDTGMGWPFYFKFDSADIQAQAQALSYERKSALITSYGWRIEMFSKFPNIVDLETAQPDQSLTSIRRWIGMIVWAVLWLFIGYKTWRWLNRKKTFNAI